jgi:hypothetical protein
MGFFGLARLLAPTTAPQRQQPDGATRRLKD